MRGAASKLPSAAPFTLIFGKPPCSRRITGLMAAPNETNVEDAEAEDTPAPSPEPSAALALIEFLDSPMRRAWDEAGNSPSA